MRNRLNGVSEQFSEHRACGCVLECNLLFAVRCSADELTWIIFRIVSKVTSEMRIIDYKIRKKVKKKRKTIQRLFKRK